MFDRKANRSFYGHDVTTDDIFLGTVKTDSESARRFIAAIVAGLSPAAAAGTAAAPSGPAPVVTPAARGGPAQAGGSAHSFPLADPKPGASRTDPHVTDPGSVAG